ncbi:MAG: ECF transporter S component [Candidatus Wallbacteria bacterium]|nr:ECF transporter S component [Candidatus Wallbacteria bacterium]
MPSTSMTGNRVSPLSAASLAAHSSFFLAFSVLLPSLFHWTGVPGPMFLPMHIPVLLCGLLLGPKPGGMVGLAAPLASAFLTGMPPLAPLPVAQMMAFELCAYGSVAGLMRFSLKRGPLLCLITAMMCGRIVLGLCAMCALYLFGVRFSPVAYVSGAVLTGLPGMFLQILLLPVLGRLLGKMGVRGNVEC